MKPKTSVALASYPGFLTPAFVACSIINAGTASDTRWGQKAWVRGYRGLSLGPGRLWQHNFKHNRLSILVRIIGTFSHLNGN